MCVCVVMVWNMVLRRVRRSKIIINLPKSSQNRGVLRARGQQGGCNHRLVVPNCEKKSGAIALCLST